MTDYYYIEEESRERMKKRCLPFFARHRELASQIANEKQRLIELNKKQELNIKQSWEKKKILREIKGVEDEMDNNTLMGTVCIAETIKNEKPEEP